MPILKFVYTMDSIQPADEEARLLVAQMSEGQEFTMGEVISNKRSKLQNSSLHKWCRMCAEVLNDAGFDMRKTLRQDADIPWTEYSFKEFIWRPVQQVMTGEESTTQPSRSEYPKISETVVRHIAQRVGVNLPPWPCRDSQMLQDVA